MLADMPFVTSRMVSTLVARYRESTAPLVISAYGEVNAPPMLYDRALFPELRQMSGSGCGRQVVRRHRDEAIAASWPEAALQDVDVPEDYERIRAELGRGDPGSVSAADGAGPGVGGAANGAGPGVGGAANGAGNDPGADGAANGAGNDPGADAAAPAAAPGAGNGPGADAVASPADLRAGTRAGADDAGTVTG